MHYGIDLKKTVNALLLGAALCVALPAHATTGVWMMLGDGNKLEAGSKPNRVMHYANAAHIRDLTDQNAKIAEITKNPDPKTIDARIKAMEVKEMDVVEIYENPKAPGFKMLTMQFQCTKKLYRVAKAEAKERNSLHRFSGATEWQEYKPADWQSRAYFVACATEVWVPMVKADQEEMNRTKKVPKQAALREYGVGMIGNWDNSDGLNQVYRLTWDKIWAGSATPTPFHHNRTPAEEKEYQAWKKGNDAILAENEQAAPMLATAIAGLEGQVSGELKGIEAEQVFRQEISKNLEKRVRNGLSDEDTLLIGETEERLLQTKGTPTSVSTQGNARFITYRTTETSTTSTPEYGVINGPNDPRGGVANQTVVQTGTTTTTNQYNLYRTFELRVGGNKPQYRVINYRWRTE